MRQVPVRELNQHTADVLAMVERGERIEITRNGVAVAVIEPSQPNSMERLIQRGEYRAPTAPLRLLPDEAEAPDSAGLDAVLDDRYGDDPPGGRW